jgi:mono/diheme cytochrome c family protein
LAVDQHQGLCGLECECGPSFLSEGSRIMNRKFVCIAALLIQWGSAAATAAEKTDFDAASLFRSHCASCHGFEGKGDGPVSSVLSVKPLSLDTLTERHNGAFPYDYVYGVIDGRLAVRSHGTRDMPVWGKLFSRSHQGSAVSNEATYRSTELMIRSLVDYIKELQR